jgi:photosystem II stability/assembly factor-like uncharacterized protein
MLLTGMVYLETFGTSIFITRNMKKWYLLTGFLFTVNMIVAQWYYSTLMTPTNAVVFVNEHSGVVSTGFTLARTTDGGSTWSYVCSAAMDSIFISLSFPSETVGYAVGLSGNIVKTTDGGSTWYHLTTGSGKNLRSVFFTSENNGYVAGDAHALFRTIDGGLTWQALTSPVDMAWSMHFTSDTFGILAGNTRSIYRTQDGGVNWLEISFPSPNKYLSVHFPDESTAYACGMIDALTPCMIKSTDGGMKWTEVSRLFSIPCSPFR